MKKYLEGKFLTTILKKVKVTVYSFVLLEINAFGENGTKNDLILIFIQNDMLYINFIIFFLITP